MQILHFRKKRLVAKANLLTLTLGTITFKDSYTGNITLFNVSLNLAKITKNGQSKRI